MEGAKEEVSLAEKIPVLTSASPVWFLLPGYEVCSTCRGPRASAELFNYSKRNTPHCLISRSLALPVYQQLEHRRRAVDGYKSARRRDNICGGSVNCESVRRD